MAVSRQQEEMLKSRVQVNDRVSFPSATWELSSPLCPVIGACYHKVDHMPRISRSSLVLTSKPTSLSSLPLFPLALFPTPPFLPFDYCPVYNSIFLLSYLHAHLSPLHLFLFSSPPPQTSQHKETTSVFLIFIE